MLYIVIPVFNRKHHTRDCLNYLRKQTNQDFKVVVVDDGSTDGTDQMLEEEFPEVITLKGTGELFWTASVNMGIQYGLDHGAEYVMTLNNDTIPTDTFVEKMMYWAEKKPNAVLGALELDSESKDIVFGGERMKWRLFRSCETIVGDIPEGQRTGLHAVTHHPGRGCLIPKAVFKKIGLFDEVGFPHYYADFDFTYNAYKHGFESYINYDAILYTYPDESGEKIIRKSKNFKNYYNHLFGIRGGGNLVNFTKFTLRHCPKLSIPHNLAEGYLRRIVGYVIR